jgi:hypothetical protein
VTQNDADGCAALIVVVGFFVLVLAFYLSIAAAIAWLLVNFVIPAIK